MTPKSPPRLLAAAALAASLLLPQGKAAAHEVPADVTVQMYVIPAGRELQIFVRIPLEAVRDVDWPLQGPGYLDLARARPFLRDAVQLWVADYLAFYEDGRPLPAETLQAARLALPGDRSFLSPTAVRAHLAGPGLPDGTLIPPGQALLDALLTVPVSDPGARFSVEPRLAHLGVRTLSVIHFHPVDGAERVFQYRGNPGRIQLDPSWWQAAASFVREGFLHILGGIDHLLFLLCLIIPFRRVRPLVPVVTAFTVAHSLTLGAAALGLTPQALWFPPLVETLIALSILYMALENMVGARLHRRWSVAFAFGLVHGFGFSFLLTESLQFAGRHLVTSLLAFNVGVELGQLLVLAVAVPALNLLFRRVRTRVGTLLISALVAHTAWHWMTDRGSTLLAYPIRLPALDGTFFAALLPWAALGALALAAAWGLAEGFRRLGGAFSPTPPEATGRVGP